MIATDLWSTIMPRHHQAAAAWLAMVDDGVAMPSYGPQIVSTSIAQTSYGSMFAAGRRSSK
jgi:hypothetical protein